MDPAGLPVRAVAGSSVPIELGRCACSSPGSGQYLAFAPPPPTLGGGHQSVVASTTSGAASAARARRIIDAARRPCRRDDAERRVATTAGGSVRGRDASRRLRVRTRTKTSAAAYRVSARAASKAGSGGFAQAATPFARRTAAAPPWHDAASRQCVPNGPARLTAGAARQCRSRARASRGTAPLDARGGTSSTTRCVLSATRRRARRSPRPPPRPPGRGERLRAA